VVRRWSLCAKATIATSRIYTSSLYVS
jgi:hypothetical protein